MPDSHRLASGACIGLAIYNLTHILLFFTGDWHWAVNDDVRQNLFFMERARDGALFPRDLIADHARSFQPIGFYGLVWLLTRWFGIIAATKIAAFVTTAATFLLVVWVAHRYFGWKSPLSWLAVALFSGYLPLWHLVAAGMARGVVAPLSLLALVGFRSAGDRLFLLTIVLSGLFAPTLLLFLVVLAFWKLILGGAPVLERLNRRRAVRRWGAYALAIGASAAIIVAWQDFTGRGLGPIADYGVVGKTAAFKRDGRWWHEAITDPVTEVRRFGRRVFPLPMPWSLLLLAGLLAAVAAVIWNRVFRSYRQASPDSSRAVVVGGCFLVTGVICWIGARAVALKLYFPVRYLIPSEYGAILAAVGTLGILGRSVAHPWLRAIAVAVAAALLCANVFRVMDDRFTAFPIRIAPEERLLYEFLRGLPKDALVAGDPLTMDNVPIFSGRSVLVNYESSLPLYPDYYRQIERRTRELIDGYFGWSEDSLHELSQATGVSHLVITRADFGRRRPWFSEPLRSGPYIHPFRRRILRRLASKPATVPWAWQTVDSAALVFQNARFIVIDMRRAAGRRSNAEPRRN